MLELDSNIGKVMDAIRAEAPNTIVIITADNGAWQDAWPDAGTVPFRGEKGSPFEGGFRVPGIMWAPGKIPAGARYGEMMSHVDSWATLATMVGLTPPPHGAWKDNDGKPIYFDSIDKSAYIMGKARHSARTSWIYVDGETFAGARADIGDDPQNPDTHIAWKVLYTAKDTWLGPQQNLGAIGSYYNLTMDPFEKYDMTFNGAVSTRVPTTSPGRYAGYDNGWAISLLSAPTIEFDKSIVDFPNVKRFPGGIERLAARQHMPRTAKSGSKAKPWMRMSQFNIGGLIMTVVSISKSAPVTANASGVVNGSPELVWTVLTDLMRWPNWNRDVTAMTVEGPISPGTVFRWKSGGMFIVSQLAEVTSPTRIAWTGRTLGISAVHIWELASQDHATRIMTEESFDGVIPRLLPGMMRRMLKKALDRAIQMLVAECERQARSKL